ncbi:MAG: MMPL family transporter [Candidatus Brocadiae bacterium]|nr:MMPL family transporter [Candidatus Brocadiia bacterium]
MGSTQSPEDPAGRPNLYQRFLMRGWPAVLLAALAVAIAAGQALPRFSVEAGTDVLLNEDDADLAYYNQSRADWGSDEYLLVCVHRPGGWITAEGIVVYNDLTNALRELPHVRSITALTTVPLLRNQPARFGIPSPVTLADAKGRLDPKVDVARAREELLQHTQASGSLVSVDGKDACVLVYLDVNEDIERLEPLRNRLLAKPGDAAAEAELERIAPAYAAARAELNRRRRAMVDAVRVLKAAWDPKLEAPIRVSGLPFINIVLTEHVRSDMVTFGVIALAVFTLTYVLIYRRLRWVLLPVLTCALPVAVMIGVMAALDRKVTVVTSNAPVLLFVLMLPYTVYYIERYRERRSRFPGEAARETATRTPVEIWSPCLFSALATMAGTLAHTPSGINPVRTFGWMLTFGVAVGLAVIMLLLPSVIVPLPPVTGGPAPGAPAAARGPLRWLEQLCLRAPRGVVVFSLAILAVSIWGTTRINVETKFIDYFWPRSPIHEGLGYVDERMGGTTPFEVILTSDRPGHFRTPEGLRAIDAVSRFFETVPETGSLRSFRTLVAEAGKAVPMKEPQVVAALVTLASRKLEYTCDGCGRKRMDTMKDGLAKAPAIGDERKAKCDTCGRGATWRLSRVESGAIDEFCNWNFTSTRIILRMKETAPTLNRDRILRSLREHLDGLKDGELKGIEARPTGIFLLYSNMLNSLIAATQETFVLAVGSIFLMLCFLFRSALLSLLVLLPQILPVFLVLGTMGFAGVALDMVTVIIASVAMGVGIDAAIQYTVRFRRELEATGGDIRAAVSRSHATIGRAIFVATSIVFTGFAMLMFSNFRPTFYFGMFTGLAILMGLFASLSTLPSLFVMLNFPRLKAPPPETPPSAVPPDPGQ